MLKKNFKITSWALWALFVLTAVLILVANFIFQIIIKTDEKLSSAMNTLFIILNVISLLFLLSYMIFNINNCIEWQNPLNLILWVSYFLYIFFALSSTIVLLNSDFYYSKALFTMLSFISALFLFPFLVINLIKNEKSSIINCFLVIFVICYLIINLTLNFIIFLKLESVIVFLIIVTSLNLVVSTIFFGLLTKKACHVVQEKAMTSS